jgi:hypothetical protein
MEISKKFTSSRMDIITPGVIRAKRCALKLKYEKIKKSIFSIDNANISQLFQLDKLVNGQGL